MCEISVGIDFGTCNIKAATYDQSRNTRNNDDYTAKIRPEKLTREQGSDVLPNIANVDSTSTRVGKIFPNSKATPVKNIKRKLELEESLEYIKERGMSLSASEIASEEFAWIKKQIEEHYQRNLNDTVITVPVCFSEFQKLRIKKAAEKAGLNVSEIISEPMAGLFAYKGLFKEKGELNQSKVLVFDAGGGTTDMSVFNIQKHDILDIEALASKGIDFGGQNITQLLCDEFRSVYSNILEKSIKRKFDREFLSDTNISDEDKKPDSNFYTINYERVEKECREAIFEDMNGFKEDICTEDYMLDEPDEIVTITANKIYELMDVGIELSYSGLERIIDKSGINNTLEESLDDLMDMAMIDKDDIKKIIMIGGTSKIFYFRKLLSRYFEREDIFIDLEDDEKYTAVSVGAITYLKLKNELFRLKNRLSYEVGLIENGEYRRIRPLSSFIGEYSSRVPVIPEYSGEFLVVKIYQVFGDTIMSGESNSEICNKAVYVGCFRLDRDKYGTSPKIQMDTYVDAQGIIWGRFYDLRYNVNGENYTDKMKIYMGE